MPLNSAWAEFADSLVLSALRTHPDKDPLVFGLRNPPYKELARAGLPETAEGRKRQLEIVTQDARACLLGELYAGRWWAIGFQTLPGGVIKLIQVPRDLFFDEAKGDERHRNIDWQESVLSADTGVFVDIRVLRRPIGSDNASASDPAGQARSDASSVAGSSSPETPLNFSVASSSADVIRAAIADYAKTDPHLKRPSYERYRNYRSYVTSQGYDPRDERGYSEKTFEKYETEFRRTFK